MSEVEEEQVPAALAPVAPREPSVIDLGALAWLIALMLLAVLMMLALVHR